MRSFKIFKILSIVSLLFSTTIASVLIENGSFGAIFPAENGNMHILVRNDDSSYKLYTSDGIVIDTPLGISDSSVYFETACSDGNTGVYVLYNNTENKTLYAQHYDTYGNALWDSLGVFVDTYIDTIGFTSSSLTPSGEFVVVYDNYSSFVFRYWWWVYEGYLKAISPEGIVSSPKGEGEYEHSNEIEMHNNNNALYIKRTSGLNISTLSENINSSDGILEFDCASSGFIYALKTIDINTDRPLELHRYNKQLETVWNAPIMIDMILGKSSNIGPDRPGVIANIDGSVTLYPRTSYENYVFNTSRIDSLGEYLYENLDFGEIFSAFCTSKGENLFLVNKKNNNDVDNIYLIKVSSNGEILFSTFIYKGISWKGSIIENTDGSFGTAIIIGNTFIVNKVNPNGNVSLKEIFPPALFSMSSAYPNPFNPRTSIDFELYDHGIISLNIYNLSGQLIEKELINAQAGRFSYSFDASSLPSGVYLIKAEFNGSIALQKVVLLK
jgi:hypothetical protein